MTTLYEKRGQRYFPVSEFAAVDHLADGCHLVIVRPGRKSIYCGIEPDHAALIAASKDAMDAMCEAIQEASPPRPQEPLTRRQRAAWEAFVRTGAMPVMIGRTAYDVAEAGIKVLIQAAAARRPRKLGVG